MMNQGLYISLLLLFMIGSSTISLNAAAVALQTTSVKTKSIHVSKKKTSWFKRFIQKRIKKRLQKRLKKSPQKQSFEIDGLLLAVLSVLIGLGAVALVLLAQLATATGTIILSWLGALVVGAIAVWAGIEAWKESSYTSNKSLTRWLAFFGILFGGAILYAILAPILILF